MRTATLTITILDTIVTVWLLSLPQSRVDAADLQDLRNQLQALVLDKITQDHALHGANQASTIAQEESATLRRHLATYKETAERQEKELRDMASQHKHEFSMLRKESAEVKLALETELADLRAAKLQHDHEVRGDDELCTFTFTYLLSLPISLTTYHFLWPLFSTSYS